MSQCFDNTGSSLKLNVSCMYFFLSDISNVTERENMHTVTHCLFMPHNTLRIELLVKNCVNVPQKCINSTEHLNQ